MVDLTDLIARCESAGESEQRHMLELAWQELHNEFPSTVEWANQPAFRFARMLNAEAYLSAAKMLVPEGSGFVVMGNGAKVGRHMGVASTPALALLAASLRAMEKQG